MDACVSCSPPCISSTLQLSGTPKYFLIARMVSSLTFANTGERCDVSRMARLELLQFHISDMIFCLRGSGNLAQGPSVYDILYYQHQKRISRCSESATIQFEPMQHTQEDFKKSLVESRESFHKEIRSRKKREELSLRRQHNICILKPQVTNQQLSEEVQKLLAEAYTNPLEIINNLVSLMEQKQHEVLVPIQQHMDSLLKLAVSQYPLYEGMRLTAQLITMGAAIQSLISNRIVTRVVQVIRSSFNDEKLVKLGVEILMNIASDDWEEYQQLLQVKMVCKQLYRILSNHKQLLYLISYLGKKKEYFPADECILRGIVQGFGLASKQLRLISVDIIGGFIESAPHFLKAYWRPLLGILFAMTSQKDFCTESAFYYRKYSLKCIILLICQFPHEMTQELLSQNMILQVISMIELEPLPIKQICFRLLEAFCQEADSDQIVELVTKCNNFVDFLQVQALDSTNIYLLEPALRIILHCLGKFSECGPQNVFRNLLEVDRANFIQILDNLQYHKSHEVSSLAIEIYERYYKWEGEYLDS